MKEIRRQNPTEDRPKSHSPSTTTITSTASVVDARKKFDSNDRKTTQNDRQKFVDTFDQNSPPGNCFNATKNGSWSSADSVQHFPERDTSRQVNL
jgi:hypothetical protein